MAVQMGALMVDLTAFSLAVWTAALLVVSKAVLLVDLMGMQLAAQLAWLMELTTVVGWVAWKGQT